MTEMGNERMNKELERSKADEVHHDGLAMLGILVLTVALLAFLAYNIL